MSFQAVPGEHYVMGTGTRKMVLRDDCAEVFTALKKRVTFLQGLHPKLVLISGMAEGWDEAICWAGLDLGVPYIAMVPNQGYGKYYWGKNSLTGKDRYEVFESLLKRARQVLYGPAGLYRIVDGRRVHSNIARNQDMVDVCHEALVYNPTRSPGTQDAVRRLTAAGKLMSNF